MTFYTATPDIRGRINTEDAKFTIVLYFSESLPNAYTIFLREIILGIIVFILLSKQELMKSFGKICQYPAIHPTKCQCSNETVNMVEVGTQNFLFQ